MKRFLPLILVALFVLLFVAGTVWKIVEIYECGESGGIVVGAMLQHQHCVVPREPTR